MNVVVFYRFQGGLYIRTAESFFEFSIFGIQGRMLVPVGATFDDFSTFTCKWIILNPQLSLSIVWWQNSLRGYLYVHEIVHTHDKFDMDTY